MGWTAEKKLLELEACDWNKKKFLDEEEEDEEDYEEAESNSYAAKLRPPDGGYGWLVLIASFFLNAIIDGIGFSFGTSKLNYVEAFNVTFSEASWVGSTLTGSYLIIGPIVGALVFRWGMRRVTIAGSLIASAGFVLSSFTTSLEMLILTYGVIGGIGMGMMYLPSIVCISYWFEKKLAVATGIAVCGSGLGQFAFPPLEQYLVREYQWQGKHIILGAIVLHGVVCGALFRLPDQWYVHRRRKQCQNQRVEIERGIIMKALIEDKKRQRTTSDGSLDNCVITTNNRLIKLEPSLFHSNKSQALRKMLRQLGYSIQSLAVSKTSLQPSDQRVLMEALQQSKLDQEKNSANAPPQFLLPLAQLQKRNSSPDFNKVCTCGAEQQQQHQHLAGCSAIVSRSNSIKSNNGVLCNGVGAVPKVGALLRHSSGSSTPVKTFPKTKSCDALSQLPNVIKKIVSERVRSTSECNTTQTSSSSSTNPIIPLGSSPALPVGSVDISIQEIPTGSDAATSCYTSNTSIASDLTSQFTREYVPNSSQNMFTTTCMISGQQLEASIRELQKQDSLERSRVLRIWSLFVYIFDLKLLTRPVFSLFLFSSFFTLLAFYIPYFFTPELGVNIGMVREEADFLLSILAITSTIGRLIAGWLGDRPWINTLYLNNGALLCTGVCTFILPFSQSPKMLCVLMATLGFCLAVFVALRSVLLVKFLGVEQIPKSFGLFCLVQGTAAFAGSPCASKLAAMVGSYNATFYVAGIFTFVSGLILFPLGYLKRREERLEACRQAEEDLEADGRLMGSACAAITASPVHYMG